MKNKYLDKLERLNYFEQDMDKTLSHIYIDNLVKEKLVKTSTMSDFNFRQNMNLDLTEDELNELNSLKKQLKDDLNKYRSLLNKGISKYKKDL